MPSVAAPSRPRVCTHPDFGSSAGQEAVELAASLGLNLYPWQQDVLRIGLGEGGSKWAAFEVGLIVPRQNGKSKILEARELAGLFLFDEQMILHSAHQFKTAIEGFRSIEAIISANDWISAKVKKITYSHGDEGVELKSGARLRFIARSRTSARGFAGDCLILDEAQELSQDDLGALVPTLSTRPDPQIWYAGTAGKERAVVLRALRERGVAGESESLAYVEYSAPDAADLDDEDAWRQANPSLGGGIPLDFVQRERAALSDDMFGMERLGIWPDAGSANVLSLGSWQRLESDERIAHTPALGVDAAPYLTSAGIWVCGAGSDGVATLEHVDHRPGSAWLVDRAVSVAVKQSAAICLDPRGPIGPLVPTFEAACAEHGVELLLLDSAGSSRALGALVAAVSSEQLHHGGDPELTAAIGGMRVRQSGDTVRLSRVSSDADICPLIATANAHWAYLQATSAEYAVADSIF